MTTCFSSCFSNGKDFDTAHVVSHIDFPETRDIALTSTSHSEYFGALFEGDLFVPLDNLQIRFYLVNLTGGANLYVDGSQKLWSDFIGYRNLRGSSWLTLDKA